MTEEETKRPRKAYIAGPMSGYANHNLHAFFDAEEMLHNAGVECINPARSFMQDGELRRNTKATLSVEEITEHAQTLGFDAESFRAFIKYDLLAIINECDSIVMLPGWERSAGAKVEWELAKFLGIGISYFYPELFDEHRRNKEEDKDNG